ncbi:hypothetical protein [Actinomadura sp. NBRC 104425]|uniref:hypothetical protein n=1 Tax=Actinomadura sp. NBRC 104425 TaxID=3032204 RepID=UPI00255426A9|nr:hypothetical protein [Actinomadura sp. NBRC 104425]
MSARLAGVDRSGARRPPLRPACTERDLDAAGVGSVVWATGYRLCFARVDLPVFDEWGYKRLTRGVTPRAVRGRAALAALREVVGIRT